MKCIVLGQLQHRLIAVFILQGGSKEVIFVLCHILRQDCRARWLLLSLRFVFQKVKMFLIMLYIMIEQSYCVAAGTRRKYFMLFT